MHEQHETKMEVEGSKTAWDSLGEEVPFDQEEAQRLADLENSKNENDVAEATEEVEGSLDNIGLEREYALLDAKENGEQEERQAFAGAMLTKEELGLDKIIIQKVEPSRKKGIFAKMEARKLEKTIDRINDIEPGEGSTEELDEILSQLSPTEAYGLSREVYPSIRADLALRIIEALPVEEQESFFSERCGADLINAARYNGYEESISDSIVAKYLAGQKEALTSAGVNKWRLESFNQANMALATLGSERKVSEGLSDQIMQSSLAGQEGVDKVLLTLLCRPDDEKTVNEALGATGGDKASLADVLAIKMSGLEVSEDNKEKLSGLMALVEYCGNQYDHDDYHKFARMHENEAKTIAEIIREGKDGLGAKYIEEAFNLLNGDKREQMQEILGTYEGMDAGRREKAREFIMRQDLFESYEGDIDTMPSTQEMIISLGYEALGKLKAKEARRLACEAMLGVRFSDVCRDFTAFGLLGFSDYDTKQMLANNNVNEYYESALYEPMHPKKLNMEVLNELCEKGLITDDEKGAILTAASVMNASMAQTKDYLDMASQDGADYSELKLGEKLKNIRERLQRQTAERFTNYMQEKMSEGLVPAGEVEYEGVKIPVLEMRGDEFMFLVHRLGAFVGKDINDPAQWDKWIEPSRDSEGRPVGYISTSAISENMLNLANGKFDDKTVLYGFTDLTKGDTFRFAAEYDIYTGVRDDVENGNRKVKTDYQDFFFKHPREIIDRTLKRLKRTPGTYNEIALNRYPGGNDSPEARMRPNVMIVYGKDKSAITELVKKHAAYFGKTKPGAEDDPSSVTGIPIILIDPDKYGSK